MFAAASVLSLFFIRPTLMKKLHPRESLRRSNADALIGRTARVSQTIVENGFGRVALDGDDWKAQAADGSRIEEGQNVIVKDRDSIILTVEKEC